MNTLYMKSEPRPPSPHLSSMAGGAPPSSSSHPLSPRVLLHRFDLKGSTLGRWATEAERRDPNVTLKDLDFDYALEMEPRVHSAFKSQIEADTAWLRSLHIMDYSLLVMLHFPNREALFPSSLEASAESAGELSARASGRSDPDRDSGGEGAAAPSPGGGPSSQFGNRRSHSAEASLPAGKLAPAPAGAVRSPSDAAVSTPPRPAPRLKFGLANGGVVDVSDPDAEWKDGANQTGNEISDSLDVDELELNTLNLPRMTDADLADAYRARLNSGNSPGGKGGSSSAAAGVERQQVSRRERALHARTFGGEPVMIFAGVIDILQIYGARKKLEHQYKSMRYRNEREGISVTDPSSYAGRLATFVMSKFLCADSEVSASEAPAPGSPQATVTHLHLRGAIARGEAPAVCGCVFKKGSHFPFSWALRFVEVYSSSGLLVYYHSEQDKVQGQPPRGQRALLSVVAASSEDGGGGGGLVLSLTTTAVTPKLSGNSGRRSSEGGRGANAKTQPLQLRFYTNKERETWRAALVRILDPKDESSADAAASPGIERTNSVSAQI